MDVQHKLCVITGANSGIGKATAAQLADKGAYIIMICRNEERAEAAKEDIIRETGNSGVEVILADLAHQYEVRKAAETIRDRFEKVDLLINNAGVYPSKRKETPEGIERTFAINYLSHFLLTNLLLDHLKASKEARVINISSDVHKAGAPFFDFGNLMLDEEFNPMKAYAVSKLCNVMFTHELAKRTRETSLTTYALHPGVVSTNLPSEASWMLKLSYFIGAPFMKSPQKGAETQVYLVTSDEVKKHNGKYFKNKKISSPASIAYDDEITEALWDKSLRLANLN